MSIQEKYVVIEMTREACSDPDEDDDTIADAVAESESEACSDPDEDDDTIADTVAESESESETEQILTDSMARNYLKKAADCLRANWLQGLSLGLKYTGLGMLEYGEGIAGKGSGLAIHASPERFSR